MPRVLSAFPAALVAAVAVVPAAQARVPERFFGTMGPRGDQGPRGRAGAQWALMAQSGVKTVRTIF
jgi:hypothetical protein